MAEDQKPDSTVPLSVLDRFLKLSQENNEAYAAMVSAVDAMSSKMMELNDQVSGVKDTIDKEQLAKVVKDSMQSMQADIKTLSIAVQNFGDPQYNVLSTIGECLAHDEIEKKEIRELAAACIWVLSVIAFFQRRRLVFVFMMGVAIVTLLGNASEGAKAVIKLVLGFLG